MTQAPETRPGTLSTSSHFDQSMADVFRMAVVLKVCRGYRE
jgi:hypothetical protein